MTKYVRESDFTAYYSNAKNEWVDETIIEAELTKMQKLRNLLKKINVRLSIMYRESDMEFYEKYGSLYLNTIPIPSEYYEAKIKFNENRYDKLEKCWRDLADKFDAMLQDDKIVSVVSMVNPRNRTDRKSVQTYLY